MLLTNHFSVKRNLFSLKRVRKIITPVNRNQVFLMYNELMEKVSLGNREPDGKTIHLGNIGKVHQDVDEGKWYGGDVPFGHG